MFSWAKIRLSWASPFRKDMLLGLWGCWNSSSPREEGPELTFILAWLSLELLFPPQVCPKLGPQLTWVVNVWSQLHIPLPSYPGLSSRPESLASALYAPEQGPWHNWVLSYSLVSVKNDNQTWSSWVGRGHGFKSLVILDNKDTVYLWWSAGVLHSTSAMQSPMQHFKPATQVPNQTWREGLNVCMLLKYPSKRRLGGSVG